MKRLLRRELVVDCFAGGGGASLGIEQALGRPVDIAINHSRDAIAMHERNHERTLHYCQDIRKIDPMQATGGRPVGVLWASPDCTHFSRAKGGKPRSKKVRGLAWVVTRWAKSVRPRVIFLENVVEFQTWGPLAENGQPDPERKGETFEEWVATLRDLGYAVEWRPMVAADYGTPTTRRRLFIIARCDGKPIVWPQETHTPDNYVPAASIIEWDTPIPSIFDRKRPLAEKTLARIARGIKRYVLEAEKPYIVPGVGAASISSYYGTSTGRAITSPLPTVTAQSVHQYLMTAFVTPLTHQGDLRVHSLKEPLRTVTGANRGEFSLAVPTLVQTGYGERKGQAPRILDIHKPLTTVVAGGQKHGLAAAFLTKHYTGVTGQGLNRPVGTITTKDHHALTIAFLEAHLGPVPPIRIGGQEYMITDIGMRMLQPRELFRAQGFPDSYEIDFDLDGKPLTKTKKIALAGNSVCPPLANAIVGAQ